MVKITFRIGLALGLVLPLILWFPSPVFAAEINYSFDDYEHSNFSTGNIRVFDESFILQGLTVTYDSCDDYGLYTNAWKDGNDGATELIPGVVVEKDGKPYGIEFQIINFSRFQIVSVQLGNKWPSILRSKHDETSHSQ